MYDPDELTPEEENARYLQANPSLERMLWADWVVTVCGWEKIPEPDPAEWIALREKWYHGKAPLTSVGELKTMRCARSA